MEIRELGRADAKALGEVVFKAFQALAVKQSEPSAFPSPESALLWASVWFQRKGCRAVGAFHGPRLICGMAMDARLPVVGMGPIVMDPDVAEPFAVFSVYRRILELYRESKPVGARGTVVQSNPSAMMLHRMMGMVDREPFTIFRGQVKDSPPAGLRVRPMTSADLAACNSLGERCYGFSREPDVREATLFRAGLVVEQEGQLVGYTTGLGARGHSVALGNDGLKALILASPASPDTLLHVPDANAELGAWCRAQGLQVAQRSKVTSLDAYQEPSGPYLPSLYF
ncbi:hypothetical protein [Archangium sp.]|jgi:hypothetical protein|uniref:hypothetical protein n=1 Tax=Archangium sp. TaxID=1872627 RepID=UPI002EDA9CE1